MRNASTILCTDIFKRVNGKILRADRKTEHMSKKTLLFAIYREGDLRGR